MGKKSRAEVEALKDSWCRDPSWDIEDTPGFEGWFDELLAFRLHVAEEEARRVEDRQRDKAREVGLPGNYIFAGYIQRLEARIAYLEKKIEELTK